MTIPRRPEDGPFHQRHSCKPNTDAVIVQDILSGPGFFLCNAYNCRMSREACEKRRATAQEQSKGASLPLYGKCLECNQAKEEPMDHPKKCMVEGCGKDVKARGMCMTHYYREYSKGKFPTKRNPADPPDLPKAPESKTAQASTEKKPSPYSPENLAKRPPAPTAPKSNITKRVNVQFVGPDVALWELLKARARKNRRDIRVEALVLIENALTIPEEPEVYS